MAGARTPRSAERGSPDDPLRDGNGQGCGDAGRDEVVREAQQAIVLLLVERQQPVKAGRERVGVAQHEEQDAQGDEEVEDEGRRPRQQASRPRGHEAREVAHAGGHPGDELLLRGQEGELAARPLPARVQPGGGPSLVFELGAQVAHRQLALAQQGRARKRHREHEQHEHECGQAEGGAGGAEPGPQQRLEGLEADGEHHRPADLNQEGLYDPIGEPGQQQDGAVEEQERDAPALAIA